MQITKNNYFLRIMWVNCNRIKTTINETNPNENSLNFLFTLIYINFNCTNRLTRFENFNEEVYPEAKHIYLMEKINNEFEKNQIELNKFNPFIYEDISSTIQLFKMNITELRTKVFFKKMQNDLMSKIQQVYFPINDDSFFNLSIEDNYDLSDYNDESSLKLDGMVLDKIQSQISHFLIDNKYYFFSLKYVSHITQFIKFKNSFF